MAICQFFLNGNCRFGDKCRNSHQANEEVCQFFLKGNCRYGDRCFKKHPGGGNKGFGGQAGGIRGNAFARLGTNQNAFAPLAKLGGNEPSFQNNRFVAVKEDDTEKIVQFIRSKAQEWDASKMWPLSCFGYTTEKPCLAGLMDYSPEELRVAAYKAKEDGNSSQYITGVTRLMQESNARKKELSVLSLQAFRAEEQRALQAAPGNNPFSNQSMNSHNTGPFSPINKNSWSTTPLHSSSNQTATAQSQFGSSSLFGSSTNTSQNQNPFQSNFGQSGFQQSTLQPSNQQSHNPFLSSNQNSVGGINFSGSGNQGQNQSVASVGFGVQPGSATLPTGKAFGQSAAPQGTGGLLPTPQQWQTSAGILGAAPANPFLNPPTQSILGPAPQQAAVAATTTSVASLSEKDIQAFKADSFVLGQIPEVPPPPEFCA